MRSSLVRPATAWLSWATLLAFGCSPTGDAVSTASALRDAPSKDVPLSFADLAVENVGGMARFRGAQVAGEPGRPELPVKVVRLLLDPDADLRQVEVTIEDAKEVELQGSFQVQAARPMLSAGSARWPSGARIIDGKDVDVYEKNAFFPASNVGRVTPGQLHRYKIVEVAVVPYRWNPVTGALRALESGRLVVRAAAGAAPVAGSGALDARHLGRAMNLIANFDAVIGKYQPAASASGIEQRQGALTAGANGYAILTTEQIKAGSYLDRFADAKVAKGFTVEVVTETNDYLRSGGWVCRNGSSCGGGWGGGTGNAAAERLRAWMKANYAGHNLAYVLLVGNPDPSSGDVPMKLVHSVGSTEPGVPTDLYYAELSGSWDFDGDGFLGEYDDATGGDPDVYSEVSVGRIPFYGSFGDLNHILLKTIAYGNAASGDIAWRKNALLAMKPLDTTSLPSYATGEWIRASELTPGGWASTRVYDRDFGVAPEVTPCTYDTVLQSWRAAPRGLAVWSSHGNSGGSSEIIRAESTAQLDDVHPSFTIAMSCSIALPENQNNLVYSLLRNGAVAAVGATREDWYTGEPMGLSGGEPFISHYVEHIVQNQAAGDALSAVHVDQSADWQNIAVHNLYGDPSLAIDASGSGVAVPPAMQAPTVAAGDQHVKLTWVAMPEASAYVVKRASAAAGPYYDIVTTSSNVTTYTDRQVVNGAAVFYVVVARNAGGDGLASPPVSATPSSPIQVQYQVGDTNPNDSVIAPVLRIVNTGLVAQPLSAVSARYYFSDENPGDWSFVCESATVGCGNVRWYQGSFPSHGASSFLFLYFGPAAPSLAPGQSVEIRGHISHAAPAIFNEVGDYSYEAARLTFAEFRRVPAYIDGVLRWGDEPLMTPFSPDSPGYISAVAGNGFVNVSWAAVNGVSAYKVYRSEGGAAMVRLDTVSATKYVDQQVNNGTAYTYYVSALNGGGESWAGGGITVTPDASLPAIAPAAPTNLTAQVEANGLVSVCWDASPGASAYHVKLVPSSGPSVPIAQVVSSTCTWAISVPAAGEVYAFVVSAYNAAGEGPASEEIRVNAIGALPARGTGLAATPGNAQVALSWDAASRATGYRVYRSQSGGQPVLVGTTQGAGATTFTSTGLANGTTYTFTVSGTNDAGEGPISTPVSASPAAPMEPCSPAQNMTGGQSGNFNTTGPVCKRTTDNIVGWGCSNFAGRTVKINGVAVSCGQTPLPPKHNGYYYFEVSAGTYAWASLYWWQ